MMLISPEEGIMCKLGSTPPITAIPGLTTATTLGSLTLLNELVPLLPYGVPITTTSAPVSPSQTVFFFIFYFNIYLHTLLK
ncbi:hypothetical protein Btru_003807 [Bulinus truncatus]|nr:hypothetical protein Btru_003807 [Bulinus truncatus]